MVFAAVPMQNAEPRPILSRLGSSHSDARSLAAGRVLASHSSILALTSSGHSVISLHHSGVGDAAQRETSFAGGNACSPVARRHADDLAVIARAQLRLPAAVVELEALVPAFMLAGLARRHKHREEGRAHTYPRRRGTGSSGGDPRAAGRPRPPSAPRRAEPATQRCGNMHLQEACASVVVVLTCRPRSPCTKLRWM